jgi:hypothetical protein
VEPYILSSNMWSHTSFPPIYFHGEHWVFTFYLSVKSVYVEFDGYNLEDSPRCYLQTMRTFELKPWNKEININSYWKNKRTAHLLVLSKFHAPHFCISYRFRKESGGNVLHPTEKYLNKCCRLLKLHYDNRHWCRFHPPSHKFATLEWIQTKFHHRI